ncbi:MAG: phospholipid-binding lipoprotein MlaA [Cryomorphaceae bacterium]|jgi:phospholipid-binding lipoprotein MlaA
MNTIKILSLLTCLCLLAACNTLQKTDDVNLQKSADPLQYFNRKVYAFNDVADKAVLRPIAVAYSTALPRPARSGIGHFFDNLGEPLNVLNNLLQGKFDRALHSTYRFTVNSTLGLFGFFDVAKRYDVVEKPEDFGQTLAAWGVEPGPYLVLPFFGPSNARDGFGQFSSSLAFFPNSIVTDSSTGSVGLSVIGVVDSRASVLGASSVLDSQLDPYQFLKVAYETSRVNRLYDGDPPLAPEEDYDF